MGNTQSTDEYPTIVEKKKPKPFVGTFFDGHMVEPHQQVKKPNRAHVNYFEVAAVTQQPARSVKSSNSTNNSSHKKKTSTVYPESVTAVQKEPEDYIMINKRKYWKGHHSSFMLPCDDDELDRTMTLHYILKAAYHNSFTAPVHNMLQQGTKVLDIGCGSGTWILEMASEFPQSEFYGIDHCPLFPTHIKPTNAHFKLEDVTKGLPFPDNEFDYVYMRLMVYYFTPQELSQLLIEISRIMKPGGYIEMVDTNYTIRHPGPISNKIVNNDFKQCISSQNNATDINHPIFNRLMFIDGPSFIGNFIDISQEHVTLPIGDWEGGQLGKLHGLNFQLLLSSIHTNKMELDKHTIAEIMAECDEYKSYLDWFSCFARKPPVDELEQSTLDSIYEFAEGFIDV